MDYARDHQDGVCDGYPGCDYCDVPEDPTDDAEDFFADGYQGEDVDDLAGYYIVTELVHTEGA